MMNRTLLLFAALSTALSLTAQSDAPFQCGHDEVWRLGADAQNDPTLSDRIDAANAELEAYTRDFEQSGERGGGGYIVPIVFHIIHNNGPENIGDEQILDAVRILNDDFNKLNPDWDNVRSEFLDRVADVGVEFRLAGRDPQGNCTNGITRTVSELTNAGDEDMKALIVWPRNKYLNVWVAASANGAAGYTFRPGTAQWYPLEDGIVLQHTYTGSIGTSSPGRSRALTHEVGHWINLPHTWGDGNTPAVASNCNMDDGVSDTPNTIGWTSCNLSGTTCGSLDNVENYMDYSYCSKMFTNGQGTRMIASLNSATAQRNQLWQTTNLINTGTNGNATLCAARFETTSTVICEGATVTYTDLSYNNVTGRTWSFPGGTPSSSTSANPVVTYSDAGIYSATLTVTDGNTSLSTTANDLVTVSSDPGGVIELVEGFETAGTLPELGWVALNPNGDNGFQVTNAAAYTGSASTRLQNNTTMVGKSDILITPTVDLREAEDVVLSFRYAFARRSSSNDDLLRISVSNTCGETWSLRKQMRASNDLTTGGTVSTNFVPNGPDEWGYAEVTTISSSYHVSNFRVQFEFISDGGNNLYIDDVNINGMTVGLSEVLSGEGAALVVMPNPATDNAQAVLNVKAGGKVRVDLVDVLGRTIVGLHQGDLPRGVRRIDIPVSGLPSGLYFIRMMQEGRSEVVRFVVE